MILSKKYKEAMDKIILSDELKTKIIENAAKNHFPVKEKTKHTKLFHFRYAISYAACLLICFLVVSVSKNFSRTDIMPPVTNTPSTFAPVSKQQDSAVSEPPSTEISQGYEPVEQQGGKSGNNAVYKPAEETTEAKDDESASLITPEQSENYIPPLSENHTVKEDDPPEMSSGNDFVGIPVNPITEWENFSDVCEQLGYDFKIPKYIPEGYKLDTVSLLFESLVQISYLSENDEILYRTERTMEDISGDYTVYDTVETEIINGIDTTLKGGGEEFYGAVWNDGETSYSIKSTNGLERDTLVKMAESVDYFTEEPHESDADNTQKSEKTTDSN